MMQTVRRMTTLALTLTFAASMAACSGKEQENEENEGPETAETTEVATTAADSAMEADSMAAWMAEAKITDAVARETAMKEVPGGMIKEGGLEREDGKLIYSFDIAVTGKEGIEEVAIDAITGKVLSKVHETPADEAKEAAEDAAKAAGAKKPGS